MAGELLTAPGDIEWAGLLFSIEGPMVSDYWLSGDSDTEGWYPGFDADDLATSVGAAGGVAVVQAMYPTVMGLCVEDPEALADLMVVMNPLLPPGELCWFDQARDQKMTATAQARRCEPSTTQGVQHLPHRVVDLMWFIARPLDIEALEDEGS